MSAICIVNLKNHNLSFKELDCLANELISYALHQKKAIFFHVRDYGFEIIQDVKMKNYFLISDSFLYKNCEFLEEPLYDLRRDTISETYMAFFQKFQFLNEIMMTIFRYDVAVVEVFMSIDGSVSNAKDFHSLETNLQSFLCDLFHASFDSAQNSFCEFPTVKFEIKR